MRDGNPTVQPDQFNFTYSFDAITMVILGGSGSVTGAIFGGVFVTFTVKMIEQLQGRSACRLSARRTPGSISNALRMVDLRRRASSRLMILRPEGLFGEREPFMRKHKPARPAPPPAAGGGDHGVKTSESADVKAEKAAAV